MRYGVRSVVVRHEFENIYFIDQVVHDVVGEFPLPYEDKPEKSEIRILVEEPVNDSFSHDEVTGQRQTQSNLSDA